MLMSFIIIIKYMEAIALYYVGLYKGIFVRVFFSRVYLLFLDGDFLDKKMFLHV